MTKKDINIENVATLMQQGLSDKKIAQINVLYIRAESFKRMISNIEPYMCECMKYKITVLIKFRESGKAIVIKW